MADNQRPTDEERRLFGERIARSLAERPLEVPPREHREQVAGLLRQLGEATFYHLLGVDPASGPREVFEGYERAARLVHPSHVRRLGLEGREGLLELLFERTTLAYLTLSDTDRRKAYDREAGPARWTALRVSAPRPEEEARRFLEQARLLAEAEEHHSAVELLLRSVSLAPDADAYALLGRLQALNPQWLEQAAASLQKALDLGAGEPGLAEALKEVRDRLKAAGREPDAATGGLAPPIPFRKPRRAGA